MISVNKCSISIFGVIYQAAGLGLCAPLYLLVHCNASPTGSKPTAQNVSIPRNVLASILPALTFGLILPTISMSLSTPSYLSYWTKANLVMLWQFFPVWTSVLCFTFSYIFSSFQLPFRPLQILRATYVSVITLSSLVHISALTLAVAPMVAPSMFNPAHAKQLTAAYLEFPPWPIQSTAKVSSMAEGALWFIQYDYILTSWAFLFWSVSLKLASVEKGSDSSISQTALQWVVALGRLVVLGPLGCAASLIWERDEAVLGNEKEDKIEVKKTQ